MAQTLRQLDVGPLPPDRAEEMAQLGYLQWLGALPGDAGYRQEALRARAVALPLAASSPAVARFCRLLSESLVTPLAPLALSVPKRVRRGGAKARRLMT
ncbi:hypothetical protein LR948_06465 [Roseivivax sp. GX 12232]|uniref:hypothetical protein n=1 Tax=Roseivivax sp. GX 12232 TaxID=2900547 RepID=UPI001E33FE00|nr:hypothetical protein [Roseivivax sp. GX 12232]MCE0504987.1 hypothetical protein [Roseivivax sp. GX 12232]